MATVQTVAILSISWAFGRTVKVLDARIHRLLPVEMSQFKSKRNKVAQDPVSAPKSAFTRMTGLK